MAQALRVPSFFGVRDRRGESRLQDAPRQWSPVRSLQSTPWLREVYDRLIELSRLRVNWDSYGGRPVRAEALVRARKLLSNLQVGDFPMPHVSPVPDGGLVFHWRVADRDLEIEIEPNGTIRFLRTELPALQMEDGEVESLARAQEIVEWLLAR